MTNKYLILAYYHFADVKDPALFVKEHKKFFKNRDVKGRIYLSHEGINGQMSGLKEDCKQYMSWLKTNPGFEDVFFKVDPSDENIFFKMTVKVRDQLVAFDQKVNLNQRSKHLSPTDWKQHLEGDEDFVLIDVRNDYESKIGHFKGAVLPPCSSFREFGDYTEKEIIENQSIPKDKKILMYCTAGIRCEYYSAYMKEKGYQNVYQLEGGVVNYAHEVGDEHWEGKLFVFDDRLVHPLSKKQKCISQCKHCEADEDTYYNCANMDCNYLFTCCKSCLEKYAGCCCDDCTQAERVRPITHLSNKPFRKWYYYLPETQPACT